MKNVSRYELLDIIRGGAAFAVILWHWKHFYFIGDNGFAENYEKTKQPFYDALFPLYNYGGIAVDFFFLISGFIFYTLYSKKISSGEISLVDFFILRFSRLYPLHIVTLIAVAILQTIYFSHEHNFYIYAHNDLYHFILNAFFASSWGIEKGDSFNGPVWSVSVEIALYAIFYAACKLRLNTATVALAFVIASFALPNDLRLLSRGLLSFFMGGLCFFVIHNKNISKLPSGKLITWSLVTLILSLSLITSSQVWTATAAVISTLSRTGVEMPISDIRIYYIKLIVFPLTLIMFSILEKYLSRHISSISWIGNATYSSYLLHFPLQMVIAIAVVRLNLKIDFNSGKTFVLFMIFLLSASFLSYYKFELPVQKTIRRFLRKSEDKKRELLA